MTKAIREKLNRLATTDVQAGNRLIRILLEEICTEIDKLKEKKKKD